MKLTWKSLSKLSFILYLIFIIYILLIGELFQAVLFTFMDYYIIFDTLEKCSFIFILMSCFWESPSPFEPNHFVSFISQIVSGSTALLHNHECSCIIKHLILSYPEAEFEGLKEHHPTTVRNMWLIELRELSSRGGGP